MVTDPVKRKGCSAHGQGVKEHVAPHSVLRVFLKSLVDYSASAALRAFR